MRSVTGKRNIFWDKPTEFNLPYRQQRIIDLRYSFMATIRISTPSMQVSRAQFPFLHDSCFTWTICFLALLIVFTIKLTPARYTLVLSTRPEEYNKTWIVGLSSTLSQDQIIVGNSKRNLELFNPLKSEACSFSLKHFLIDTTFIWLNKRFFLLPLQL